MRLSFTSLSTPDWTLGKIIRFAGEVGYDGIELRCDYGHKHGVSAGFRGVRRSTPEMIGNALSMLQDAGVDICLLGTSVAFSSTDPRDRRRNIEEVHEYVMLATKLNCRMIRVFGGQLPEGVKKEDAIEYIAGSLSEIGRFAEDYGVRPVIEQHDYWRRAEDLVMIMKKADEVNLGVNWHLRENDTESLRILGGYLRHTHIKQSAPFLLDTMRVLKTIGYDGYLSFEGGREHRPDKVLKEHASRMREYLAQL